MPTTDRIVALATVLVAACALAGCVGETPEPSPSPSPDPTSTPVFASEEEALAAATEAYEEYQAISDLILSEGGEEPERVDAEAVNSARSDSYSAFQSFAQSGYRSVGRTTFSDLVLQQYVTEARDGEEVVVVYTCVNVSSIDVLDAGGTSVVSPNRPDMQAFRAGFEVDASDQSLVVSSNEAREGAGICPPI